VLAEPVRAIRASSPPALATPNRPEPIVIVQPAVVVRHEYSRQHDYRKDDSEPELQPEVPVKIGSSETKPERTSAQPEVSSSKLPKPEEETSIRKNNPPKAEEKSSERPHNRKVRYEGEGGRIHTEAQIDEILDFYLMTGELPIYVSDRQRYDYRHHERLPERRELLEQRGISLISNVPRAARRTHNVIPLRGANTQRQKRQRRSV
jgi:hypothetical protein